MTVYCRADEGGINMGLSYTQKKRIQPYMLLFPAFFIVLLLTISPLVTLVKASLYDIRLGERFEDADFVGLSNYKKIVIDGSLGLSLKRTILYIGGTTIPELLLGFGIALLIHRKGIIGKNLAVSCFIIPMIMMPSMIGLVWRLYYTYDGLVNYILKLLFGVKLNWYSTELALPAAIIVDIWEWTPFFILVILAGLQSLPLQPYEAAKVDGASAWQTFKYITLPLLKPAVLVAYMLRLMDAFRLFEVIFVLFGGGPGRATEILPIYIYRLSLVQRQFGKGSAASIILIIIILSLVTLLFRSIRRSTQ